MFGKATQLGAADVKLHTAHNFALREYYINKPNKETTGGLANADK